ncbi:hypothetical protein [Chryseobacterium sp. PMSZPI]|nr:hypothetical protein [Chryseobacterium sp. PMSZPI]
MNYLFTPLSFILKFYFNEDKMQFIIDKGAKKATKVADEAM